MLEFSDSLGIALGCSLTFFRLPGPVFSPTWTLSDAAAMPGFSGSLTPLPVSFDPSVMVIVSRLAFLIIFLDVFCLPLNEIFFSLQGQVHDKAT